MRIWIADGATHDGETQMAETLLDRLRQDGHQVTRTALRQEKMAYCQGCFDCWVKSPGQCHSDDGVKLWAEAYLAADTAIFFTPVRFGGYASPLKKMVDRFLGLMSPFFQRSGDQTRHRPRYRRYPKLVVVGVVEDPTGAEARLFRKLAMRNGANLMAPSVEVRFIQPSCPERGLDKLFALFRSAPLPTSTPAPRELPA